VERRNARRMVLEGGKKAFQKGQGREAKKTSKKSQETPSGNNWNGGDQSRIETKNSRDEGWGVWNGGLAVIR